MGMDGVVITVQDSCKNAFVCWWIHGLWIACCPGSRLVFVDAGTCAEVPSKLYCSFMDSFLYPWVLSWSWVQSNQELHWKTAIQAIWTLGSTVWGWSFPPNLLLETTLGGRGPWWWPRKLWLAKHGWKRKMDAVMCTLWTCTVIRVLFYFILFSFLLVLLTHRWSQELSRLPLSLIFLKGSSLRYYNHRY